MFKIIPSDNTQFISRSVSFEDTGILRSDSTDFTKTNEDFTFGCWVKFDVLGETDPFITKWSPGQRSYNIQKNHLNVPILFLSQNGSSAVNLSWSSTVTNNIFYLILGSYDSINNKALLSVNAGNYVSASLSGGVFNSNEDFVLGGVNGVGKFNGKIDQAFFYNKVLSIEQLNTLYNGGKGQCFDEMDQNKLVSHWKLNELSGSYFDSVLTSGNTLFSSGSVVAANPHVVECLKDKRGKFNISKLGENTGNIKFLT